MSPAIPVELAPVPICTEPERLPQKYHQSKYRWMEKPPAVALGLVIKVTLLTADEMVAEPSSLLRVVAMSSTEPESKTE